MLYLRNLSSTEAFMGDPWEIAVTVPPKVREDKHARDEWITKPSTKHCCYSLWEGINPKLRISSSKGSENPPALCHGLALDFDSVATPEDRARILELIPLTVTAVEHTLTPGHWRAIICFEKPLAFASPEMAKHFLNVLAKEWKIGGGWDKPAFKEPNRYYTSSGEFEVSGNKVSDEDSKQLFASVFKDYRFVEFAQGVTLKIEEIQARLTERYPNFTTAWTGTFDFEAAGPTFWIPESSSPKSAIIKTNGIYTFSAHAPKPFYGWTELLGADFIKERKDVAFGDITQRIWRTQKEYLIKMQDGIWRCHDKGDVINMLRCEMGLSARPDDSGMSALEAALSYIRQFRRVDGAAPFLYDKREVVHLKTKSILNELSEARLVMPPAEGPVKWGPDGQMPWISHFLETLFEESATALPYFISWLALFYRSGYEMKPRSGQAAILAGGVGIGKTFLTNYMLPKMYGGMAKPNEYLTGEDTFGGQLLEAPIWAIDDASVGLDFQSRKIYSERLKAAVANRSQRFHLKFRTPVEGVTWMGRIIGTCNLDSKSVRAIIPNLDISILDKLMLFRCVERVKGKFMDDDAHLPIVDAELPYFCRYLLDYQIPAHIKCRGANGNRFGIECYRDEVLLAKAQMTSPLNNLYSALREFKEELLKGNTEPYIDMGGLELFECIGTRFERHFKSINYQMFTHDMESIADQYDDVAALEIEGKHYWRLFRD